MCSLLPGWKCFNVITKINYLLPKFLSLSSNFMTFDGLEINDMRTEMFIIPITTAPPSTVPEVIHTQNICQILIDSVSNVQFLSKLSNKMKLILILLVWLYSIPSSAKDNIKPYRCVIESCPEWNLKKVGQHLYTYLVGSNLCVLYKRKSFSYVLLRTLTFYL